MGGGVYVPIAPVVLWPAAHGLSTEDLQALGGVRVVSGQEVFGEVISRDLLLGGARPWGVLGTVGQWGWGMGDGQGPGPLRARGAGPWDGGRVWKPAVAQMWGQGWDWAQALFEGPRTRVQRGLCCHVCCGGLLSRGGCWGVWGTPRFGGEGGR